MSSTDKISQSELESAMDEYASNPNYRDIPYDKLIPPYLVNKLWKHQMQTIYAACEAEGTPPAKNKKGEVFYSRAGIICNGTGVGKTASCLGIACYDVPEPIFSDTVITTSLNLFSLKTKKLPMIQCTVICTSAKVLDNAWMRDIRQYYPSLPYYRFETIGKFQGDIKNTPEYRNKEMYTKQIKDYIGDIYNKYMMKKISQEDFEVSLCRFGDIKNEQDIKDYHKKLLEDMKDYEDELIDNKLLGILTTHKVFFVTKDSFYFLFRLFDKYRIARFIFDEPQNTTLTNQDLFGNMKKDPRIKKLRNIGGKTNSYCESSPFGFIWYCSATPQLIIDNVKNHYFNDWIARNDFLINDYSTNIEEGRMFPELVQKYVIKFPYSYCLESRPDLMALIKDYKLKCKVKAETAILRGALGSEFDQMLEDDDYQGIVDKLGIDGGSVNNILESAVTRLEIDIRKHEIKIQNYESKTPKHVVEKSIEELNKEKANLIVLKKKIQRFYGTYINGTTPEECPICLEKLNIIPNGTESKEKACCAHMSCMNVFHVGCIGDYMKVTPDALCPACREPLNMNDFKLTYDANGNNIANQVMIDEQQPKHQQNYNIDVDKEYDGKMEALKAALGPMNRQGGWYKRQKVLLFVNVSQESSTVLDEIITLCQDSGFNVRLPFKVGTIAQLEAKYPIRNGFKVKQAGSASDINKDIDNFMNDPAAWVWISRSIKDSAGLNFPGVDTSIMYSPFKSRVQLRGRSLRMNRVVPIDIFELAYI